jgi:hypothetical protein
MRHLVLGVIVAALASSGVGAQSPKLLDSNVAHFRVPNTLPPCFIAHSVMQLARTSRAVIGLERTSDCMGSSSVPDATPDGTDLGGMTVRAALDRLMALSPNYRWKEMDGVAVVRPAASWTDASDALNLQIQPFSTDNGSASEALAKILRMTTHEGRIDHRAFSVAFQGGTMVEALNALVRAHEGVVWDAGLVEDPSPTFIMVSVIAFNAGERRAVVRLAGFGKPLALLVSEQAR